MKITKSQLERIIKEELEEALGEKTINLTGRIFKKKAGGRGRWSARLMPVLVTNGGKEYPIFVIGDNPLSNRKAFAYLGEPVRVSGVMRGETLRVDPKKIATTKDPMKDQDDSVDIRPTQAIPTQAIEDDDPTRAEEPSADQDKMYGETQAEDTAPTRVDPNTLGARVAAQQQRAAAQERRAAAQQQYRRNRRAGYDIKRTPWAARKRTQVPPGREEEKRKEVGRIMNKYGYGKKEESITKNELLKMIREELAKLK